MEVGAGHAPEHIPLALAAIVLAAVLAQMLAARFRVPAIIPLLLAGIALGPYGLDAFDSDELLGNLLDPFVSLSVGAILFDGALTLRRESLEHGVGPVVARLCTFGVALTWGMAAAAAGLILGLDHRIAILLGAVLTLSGPTVVVPMLDFIRPTKRPDAILRWEGILVDPIGAILAVITYHAILGGRGRSTSDFAITVGVGVLWGSRRRRARDPARAHRSMTPSEATAILASCSSPSRGRRDPRRRGARDGDRDGARGERIAAGESVERAIPEFGETLVGLLSGCCSSSCPRASIRARSADLGVAGMAFVAVLS